MELTVYLHTQATGSLRQAEGKMSFAYNNQWLSQKGATPLSLSLPLQEALFGGEKASPFFSGLLPEGEVRQKMARHFGISPRNDFALLAEIGRECAGALSLWPRDQKPDFKGDYRFLSHRELKEKILSLHKIPLNVQEMRLSLAGAQEKTALYFDGKKWFIPRGFFPSSHIIKPPIAGFEETTENEAFCMGLARQMEIPIANSQIMNIGFPVLVLERFDRKKENNRLLRIHQEDLCQALGIDPDLKYESEGGPGLADCFLLLENHCKNPLEDKRKLLDWVFFNYFVGNADAHAKNISWFILPDSYELTPFYDLLSTAVYPELTSKMAMKIGGENRPDWISIRHWEALAEEIHVQKKYLLKSLKGFGIKILATAASFSREFCKKQGNHKIIPRILKIIKKRQISF